MHAYINGSAQDCGVSITNVLDIWQYALSHEYSFTCSYFYAGDAALDINFEPCLAYRLQAGKLALANASINMAGWV